MALETWSAGNGQSSLWSSTRSRAVSILIARSFLSFVTSSPAAGVWIRSRIRTKALPALQLLQHDVPIIAPLVSVPLSHCCADTASAGQFTNWSMHGGGPSGGCSALHDAQHVSISEPDGDSCADLQSSPATSSAQLLALLTQSASAMLDPAMEETPS